MELRSWMENAPRNIPGIVWEQFSRQPRNDVSFPLRYKSAEVAGPQQTATALPRASSTLKEPLTLETTSKHIKRDRRLSEGIPKDSSEDRLYLLFIQTGNRIPLEHAEENLSKMLMLTVVVTFLGSLNLVSYFSV